jgi:hypothetical protein
MKPSNKISINYDTAHYLENLSKVIQIVQKNAILFTQNDEPLRFFSMMSQNSYQVGLELLINNKEIYIRIAQPLKNLNSGDYNISKIPEIAVAFTTLIDEKGYHLDPNKLIKDFIPAIAKRKGKYEEDRFKIDLERKLLN